MQVTTTPRKITDDIRRFCRSIAAKSSARYLKVTPSDGSVSLECFENVRAQIGKTGGRMQLGWTIWEWPGVFLEAEFHAVYSPNDGSEFIDLTPASDGEGQRLFLPDDSLTYDFGNPGIRVDNRRFALRRDPLIDEFFAIAERRTALMNTVPGVGMVSLSGLKLQEYEAIEHQIAGLMVQMFRKYAGRNSVCICGSGKKYKNCHGAAR